MTDARNRVMHTTKYKHMVVIVLSIRWGPNRNGWVGATGKRKKCHAREKDHHHHRCHPAARSLSVKSSRLIVRRIEHRSPAAVSFTFFIVVVFNVNDRTVSVGGRCPPTTVNRSSRSSHTIPTGATYPHPNSTPSWRTPCWFSDRTVAALRCTLPS